MLLTWQGVHVHYILLTWKGSLQTAFFRLQVKHVNDMQLKQLKQATKELKHVTKKLKQLLKEHATKKLKHVTKS